MTSAITTYLRDEKVKERFSEILGKNDAASYIASVLLAVANSEKLQECTPQSIYISALRAATLHLSVDPILGQAYLVPFKQRATLIIGYKGLYDLALRTNQYRYINIDKVYEGEEIVFDRITGNAHLGGEKKSDIIIGFVGAFQLTSGFSKVIYMSVDEIEAHAKRYSKSYNLEDSLWKTEKPKMQRKTILRTMLKNWGYFDPRDAAIIGEIEGENETIDGEIKSDPTPEITAQSTPVPVAPVAPPPMPEPPPQMTTAQALSDLGFDL